MRIALLVVLAFAGLWFVALRPKAPAAEPTTPPAPASQPAANGVTSAPAKAEDAVAKADAGAAKAEKAAKSEPASKPAAEKAEAKAAAPKTSKPAEAAKAEPVTGPAATPSAGVAKKRDEAAKVKRVLADIEAKKIVVLLFWDRRSSDDREVYRAVEATNRRGGKVSVRAAPIQQLGAYDAITKGLPINASPSVVVIDERKQAQIITGLTVTSEVDSAVRRALARS
jgi:hypothetical protein